ncbi:hypothetical protein HAX54_003579, partial [Datura stramonium]|nr:hypothetical protein [Datura stramonium]
ALETQFLDEYKKLEETFMEKSTEPVAVITQGEAPKRQQTPIMQRREKQQNSTKKSEGTHSEESGQRLQTVESHFFNMQIQQILLRRTSRCTVPGERTRSRSLS